MRHLVPGEKGSESLQSRPPGCSIMNVMHLKVIGFLAGPIVLQCFMHVWVHFQPLSTKLILGYSDRGS